MSASSSPNGARHPRGLAFSDALMREVRERFLLVERDHHGRERLYFDNAGGSFRLKAAIERFAPQALVLPMGFDTYRDDPISVLRLDFDAYRAVGERLRALALPTVIVQEGGYMVEALGPGLAALLAGLNP